ncbi:membrane protease regulatory membrane protein [Arthrobacter crystallopoietes BAB-32]|uniref:Membrane protease regulatory membrane protein n=1 Tax=Arthrobacter crystallopoietes BAB-32 TaxID=1246476 RepID=N1UYW9_9MICC|nr:NfeD family protein [Arthrobacter crystallopoietes]EMY35596.1 membrane protease regulatory membrane protein [Arthrobacter crystallopoietes BAB-32]
MLEWLVTNSWVLWLALFLILAIVEIMTLDLLFIMMSSGALVALFTALLGWPFWLQVVVFCVVALLMVLFVRPVALRHLRRGPREQATNIERLIGEQALALETVTDHTGMVKIGGDTWTARSSDGSAIPAGARVAVERIDGATAVVYPTASPGPYPAQ